MLYISTCYFLHILITYVVNIESLTTASPNINLNATFYGYFVAVFLKNVM